MSVLVLVVDDEPDLEPLFRRQFRRDLRSGRGFRWTSSCPTDRRLARPECGRPASLLAPLRRSAGLA